MTKRPGPSVRRRQLGAMLRQLRKDAGKNLKDAAEWLETGDSAISKVELGRQSIKSPSVRALCQLYDVDASTTDTLLRLAREASQRGWWTAYRDTLPEWFRQFVGLEGDAEVMWEYQAEFVPGLLQTPAYLEAITPSLRPSVDDAELKRLTSLRRERQKQLDGGHPPRMMMYINEAVLWRKVGGSDVMREQLDYLAELAEHSNITLRVVPFSVGAHPAMASSFVMMQFPDEQSPAFVYVENRRGAVYQEDPGDIETYRVIVDQLAEVAASEPDSQNMFAQASRSL